MKLKRLTPEQVARTNLKLSKWAKLVKRLKFNLKALKKHGFRKMDHEGMSNFLYINRKAGIIVKTPYLCYGSNNPLKKLPALAIPTVILKNTFHKYDDEAAEPNVGSQIFIQPLADVPYSCDEAETLVWLIEKALRCETRDLHEGNVATFLGCPVRIDW